MTPLTICRSTEQVVCRLRDVPCWLLRVFISARMCVPCRGKFDNIAPMMRPAMVVALLALLLCAVRAQEQTTEDAAVVALAQTPTVKAALDIVKAIEPE